MIDNTVLKNENIYRVFIYTQEILDDKGNVLIESKPTGEYLEFDLEDIELPFKYQELADGLKKSKQNLRNQFIIIEKKQDHKGKKLLSANEEAKFRALNEFFKEQARLYNLFLGENGVEKLLYGRKLGWSTLSEIDKIIETTIAPKLDLTTKNITKKIKEKYSLDKEENVLE